MSTVRIVGVWIAVLAFIGIGMGGLALTGETQSPTITIEHTAIPPFRG